VLTGASRDGQPIDVAQGQERGRPVYQVPIELAAGASTELTFQLTEPPTNGVPRTFLTPLVKPAAATADEIFCGSG
jgi:hypothetical protein